MLRRLARAMDSCAASDACRQMMLNRPQDHAERRWCRAAPDASGSSALAPARDRPRAFLDRPDGDQERLGAASAPPSIWSEARTQKQCRVQGSME